MAASARRTVARHLSLVVVMLCSSIVSAGAQSLWTLTDNMADGRYGHTLTALPDGRALIAGGIDATNSSCRGAELYNATTRSFARVGGLVPTALHTATLLADGMVLIAGGYNCDIQRMRTDAQLFDPSTGTFSPVGSLGAPRAGHTATRLADGRVLVTGGLSNTDEGQVALASVEIYDPATRSFSPGPPLATPRGQPAAARLPDGRVLVVGGQVPATFGQPTQWLANAEIYDPASDAFTPTAPMHGGRSGPTATLLADGRVLIAGGMGEGVPLATAELFQPETGEFTATGSMSIERGAHAAHLLPDGSVLVLGGFSGSVIPRATEIFDPAAGQFSAGADMNLARIYPGMARLNNGSILVTGGVNGGGVTATAETFEPPPAADAGPDQLVATNVGLATVTLTGSGSGLRHPLTYAWSGPDGPLGTTATVTVQLAPGTYEYRFTVTDARGVSASDTVTVTVVIDLSNPPVANAGADVDLLIDTLEPAAVTLSGTVTNGVAPYTYAWSGSNGASSTTSTLPLQLLPGRYEFLFVVRDVRGLTSSDTVVVTVTLDTSNPPMANAGEDQSVTTDTLARAAVTLNGTSTGGLGPFAYEWSGPLGVVSTSPQAALTLSPGVYEFQFKVTDRRGLTATDRVSVAVHLPGGGGAAAPTLSFALRQTLGNTTLSLPAAGVSTVVLAFAAEGQRATATTTVTLPAAAGTTGRFVVIRRMDREHGRLVVRAPAGTIVGGPEPDGVILAKQFEEVVLVSDGATWIVFSR